MGSWPAVIDVQAGSGLQAILGVLHKFAGPLDLHASPGYGMGSQALGEACRHLQVLQLILQSKIINVSMLCEILLILGTMPALRFRHLTNCHVEVGMTA